MAQTDRVIVAESEVETLTLGIMRVAWQTAKDGTSFPGEIELARQFDTSRAAVRRALAPLEKLGVLRRQQGVATQVDDLALRLSARLDQQLDHTVLLERLGYAAAVELLEFTEGAVPSPLESEKVDRGLRIRKRWRADGRVAMVGHGVLAVPRGVAIPRASDASVFELAATLWNEPVIWEIATPSAIILSDDDATVMELPAGSPVLTLEIIGVTGSGHRAFWALEHHDPDVVTFSAVRSLRPPWGSDDARR